MNLNSLFDLGLYRIDTMLFNCLHKCINECDVYTCIDNAFPLFISLVPGDPNKEDNGPIPLMEGDATLQAAVGSSSQVRAQITNSHCI